MSLIKNFNFSEKEVSAIAIDEVSRNFLWIAFKQNTLGNCVIKKVSAFDLYQTYFNVNLAVTEIVKLGPTSPYIFAAVQNNTNYAYRYSLSNPLASPTAMARPSGVNENPVDFVIGTSNIFFLFPGSISGEVAKIVKTSLSGTFVETIDLEQSGDQVLNAKSITIDTNDNLWVVTYTDPSELVRVYDPGSGYILQITEI